MKKHTKTNSNIFPTEREALFTRLLEAEKGFDWYRFHHIDTEKLDEMLNDKAFRIPKNSYHFISQIITDTMVVDKLAAVRYLLICEFPFDHEVKGLTRHFVERVKAALALEIPIVLSPSATQGTLPVLNAIPDPSRTLTEMQGTSALEQNAPPNALPETTVHEQQDSILIPRALWEGKKPQQVCADMRVAGHTDDAPIAHALHYWVGIKNLTELGTILRGDGISDSARHKYAREKLKKAEGRYRTE